MEVRSCQFSDDNFLMAIQLVINRFEKVKKERKKEKYCHFYDTEELADFVPE